ncbi:MAG: sigma-70 family RNA polymerase sigma factor [Saprospiraceae bacterium]|nr:sigma-70 family RNA polymerase sigma factor [Saprospiraceae bacterium]
MDNYQQNLDKAKAGDIHAFQSLFINFQDQLKSYLFRLLASRADAEDIAHDTFIRAFDKLASFRGDASLKTWVFQIATNLAHNTLQKRKRWTPDVSQQAKDIVLSNPLLVSRLEQTAQTSPFGKYEIKEHIDTCFTCIGKNLPIENQMALLLKDVYDFSVKEIMQILHKSEGQVKYFLQKARTSMTDIFDHRCALVNQEGICHQCSELNGWFNPKQNLQEAKMKIRFVREAEQHDKQKLFDMRTQLIKALDPLRSDGNELQSTLLDCNRMAMGEMAVE